MQSVQKLLSFVVAASVFIAPLPSDATPFEVDVSLSPGSVLFVPRDIYVGEPVRIYANIANLGSKDVTGQVGFYQGPNLLAPPHPFSLRADSVTEDVWIDWTPTEGRYNIMVKADTTIPDQSPSNNAFLTPMMLVGKRPPPPVSQPTQPVSGQQQNQNGALTQQAGGETSKKGTEPDKTITITKKLAQTISETLTPKLPLNPPAEREAQKVQKSESAAGAKSPRVDLPVQTTAILEANAPSEEVPQPTTAAPQEVRGDRAFADRISRAPLNDSTRRVLLVGILLAAASLAAGGYFLHKSKA